MKKYLLLFVLVVLTGLGGCVTMDNGHGSSEVKTKRSYVSGRPQLSVLLDMKENTSLPMTLELADVEISAGERWVSLLDGHPLIANAKKLGKGQWFVNRLELPPGNYKTVRFTFNKGAAGAVADNLVREQSLSPALSLNINDSTCLFLTWDVEASRNLGGGRAVITAAAQNIPLTTELAYASCPDINTIYIIRTDSNRICGSWGVSGYPTYLNVSKERNELTVLAARQDVIKIVELSSGRIKDAIKIPMVMEPVFMVLDKTGNYAFLLDNQSNYLTKIYLRSGSLLKRSRVVEKPNFLTLVDENTLALTSDLSQKVLLLSSNDLQIMQVIPDSGGPQGLLVNGDYLYIVENKANNVARYNLNTSEIDRHQVGLGTKRILTYNDYIYITNSRSGTISILLPGQAGVARNLHVGANPGEMAVSNTRNWLYINTKAGISVVDTTSNRLAARLDLMATPLDIAVIQ